MNVANIFNAIKNAIRSKGVGVEECESPENYPEKILQIQRTGAGTDTVCIFAYKSSENQPAKPTGNPYNFNTGVITYPEGWSTIDNLSGTIWYSHIVVTSNTNVVNGIVEDWSKPIKLLSSINLSDIIDYDDVNAQIAAKIEEDYQAVYEDYTTAIDNLQEDVDRYKGLTDNLEDEYHNLVIKTSDDLAGVTQNIAEQILDSEGFTTKVTEITEETGYVTQTEVEETAEGIVSTALEGTLNEEGHITGGRFSQIEQKLDEIGQEVLDPNTGTSSFRLKPTAITATVQDDTGDIAAAIMAEVNEDGSNISLKADKINLVGGQSFIQKLATDRGFISTLTSDQAFIHDLNVDRLDTASNQARVHIEDGQLVVSQYINGAWIRRLSLGYDPDLLKVAIVIYDENGIATKDLTDAGLTDRDSEHIRYILVPGRELATMQLVGWFYRIPDTNSGQIGWPSYIQGGFVPSIVNNSIQLYRYIPKQARIERDGVLTNEYVVYDPTVTSDSDSDYWKSTCAVDNLIFTRNDVFSDTSLRPNWSDYVASGHYRNAVEIMCGYEYSNIEQLSFFRSRNINNGIDESETRFYFDAFKKLDADIYVPEEECDSELITDPSEWAIHIAKVKNFNDPSDSDEDDSSSDEIV